AVQPSWSRTSSEQAAYARQDCDSGPESVPRSGNGCCRRPASSCPPSGHPPPTQAYRLDGAGGDELVQSRFRDAHVTANLDEGDAPFLDQATRVAHGGVEEFGHLVNGEQTAG